MRGRRATRWPADCRAIAAAGRADVGCAAPSARRWAAQNSASCDCRLSHFCSVSSTCTFAPTGQPFSQPWATPRVQGRGLEIYGPTGQPIAPEGWLARWADTKIVVPPPPWAMPRAGQTAARWAGLRRLDIEQNRERRPPPKNTKVFVAPGCGCDRAQRARAARRGRPLV